MDCENWFKNQFGKSFEESFKNADKKKIKMCLSSVCLAREQTSLNDFVVYAHSLANEL